MLNLDWLAAREAVNLGLLLCDLCVIWVVGRMLWRESYTPGWLNRRYNQAGVAFIVYIAGHTVARGWGQVLLASIRAGRDPTLAENLYHIAFFANMFAFVGLLVIVKVFTPREKNLPWAIVLTISGLAMIVDYVRF